MLNQSYINNLYSQILSKTKKIDKFVFFCLTLFPFSLTSSIFIADLICVTLSLTFLYIIFNTNNSIDFAPITKNILTFIILYLIILVSLIFSDFKSKSFLPSFFYFRYFLLSLCVYYLLKKYDFTKSFFLIIIYCTFVLIFFDGGIQKFFNYNLFGYEQIGINHPYATNYITSFFNEEKKLGSYTVRFLPVILSLIYLNKIELKKYEYILLFFSGLIVFYSSERTALLLLFIIYLFYFLISDKKKIILLSILLIFLSLFSFEKKLTFKYIHFTFEQTGLNSLIKDYKTNQPFNEKMIRYYSKEHEDLSYTAYQIFKRNYLFGTGIKSFYQECNKLKKDDINLSNHRDNKILCSSHPHNTYLQILAEIGVFGFFLIFLFFFKLLINNLKNMLQKNRTQLDKSFYFINLSIIINIMPLIPSGNIFNNWISLMIFFPIGFYLYINEKKGNEVNQK